MCNELETVSLAAYEALASRMTRIIRYLIMGWAISMCAMGLVLVISLSYTEEVVTETTTETQTLEKVAQADNQGNAIVGDGDISIGDSTSNADENQDDYTDDQANE